MTTARQREEIPNGALTNLLRPMMPGCQILPESTRVLTGYSGRHPDILITSPGRSPVVIEAEYPPATDAEEEARARLGLGVEEDTPPIEAAIALGYSSEVAEAYNKEQVHSRSHPCPTAFSAWKSVGPNPTSKFRKFAGFPL